MWTCKLRNIYNKLIYKNTVLEWGFRNNSTDYVKNDTPTNIHSTVDMPIVNLFSREMKEWWKSDGSLNLLHSFNTVRVPFIRDALAEFANGTNELLPLKDRLILDVGCGGGIMSEELAKLGAIVTGIDVSEELIDVAQEYKGLNSGAENNKPTYYNVAIEDHAKEVANYYDAVVASEVIEFVNNKEMFIRSCVHVLKPGGRIIFTAPNRTRMAQFVIIFLCENILKNTLKGIHQYEKFITPNELARILEQSNCRLETTEGLLYNPLNNKWNLSSYHGIMYILQAQK